MAHQPRPPSAGPSSFAWEGDSTLHSYCYDYMRKRGWNETASRFAKDAGIEEATWTGPPIEAPQGLLYEWWSVFWDVFIARSQKAGQRNPNADVYVEAMRAKRDPLVLHFSGPNAPANTTLPRSLAHPPRALPTAQGGPPRAQYSQMHVLEQQELQSQMQRGRPPAQVHIQRGVPGQQQQQPPPAGGGYAAAGGAPGGPPPNHPHAGPSHAGPLPPQHPQNGQQPLMQPYPPQNPHGPPSSHGSPHMIPASHPYANGRPQGPPQQQPGPMSQAMSQAMAAVGLGGRDPESLTQEEHAAVAAQMRRVGALPPTPQQGGMRAQMPMRAGQPQRMPPEQQMRQQQGPYVGLPPQQGQPMQQMPPQQRMMQGQYIQGPPPGQAGSPASPAYSGAPSPYATPHIAHMQIPTNGAQSSPSHFNPSLPPPSRQGNPAQKPRLPSAGGLPPPQGSPAQMNGLPNPPNPNAKRLVGNMEEPSPRSRKRVRGGTRDEEMFGPGGVPEPSSFEQGGPGSPGGMMGGPPGSQGFGPDGLPYRPSPSPSLMQPPDGRRVMPQGLAPHQQQQMYLPGPSPGGNFGGDPGMNGGGPGGMNGQPMMNGNLSRPASAASNHFLGAPPPGPEQRFSPAPLHPHQGGMPSQHPSPGQVGGLPVPPSNGHPGGFSGSGDPNSLAANGSRPFAGAPPNGSSASTTPLPPPPSALPDGGANGAPDANGIPVAPGGDSSFQLNVSGEDVFAGLDFDSFLNGDMFAEDGAT
ncbi:hypothetical protein JCM10213_005674 [Rhodosporidiobolus nylandii]